MATRAATSADNVVGEPESTMHSDASTIEPMACPRRTILVRHSTMKVSSAMSATKPSRLRDPKMPWMGPSSARSPWMPRIVIGTSRRMPESTSSAIEAPSSTRITSPNARTIWIVSRMRAT